MIKKRVSAGHAKAPGYSSIRILQLARHRIHLYDEAVREALLVLWQAADGAGSKRLKGLLPTLLPALERHQHLRLEPVTRRKLFAVSAASIDRLLREARAASRGAPRTPAILHRRMPSTVVSQRERPLPGYVLLRLELPCARIPADPGVCALSLTDLFSGWTEYAPLCDRDPPLVIALLAQLCARLPVTLRGIAVGADLAWLHDVLTEHCAVHGLEFTRLRPAQHGEAAPSRQTDLAISARTASLRLEGPAFETLSRLCVSASLFVNFFQSSFRLKEKHRLGSRIVKHYRAPGTPHARLLASNALPEPERAHLSQLAESLDPLQLLDEVRRMRSHLALLAAGFQLDAITPRRLGTGEEPLAPASPQAEPAFQEAPSRARNWRTHEDAFEAAWPTLQAWIHADPTQTGKAIFDRLQREFPGVYREGQLRSLQRRLKGLRSRLQG